jgi:hypothetical protein
VRIPGPSSVDMRWISVIKPLGLSWLSTFFIVKNGLQNYRNFWDLWV